MMPMVCVDAVAILFLFDLTNRSTLTSIREWYRQVRGMNKSAIPLLIGTKYDIFYTYEKSEQEDVVKQVRGTRWHCFPRRRVPTWWCGLCGTHRRGGSRLR